MKVTYEFDLSGDDCDRYGLSVFQNSDKMFDALHEISDYMRSLRKGWVEDDAEKIEDKISDIIVESNIGEIE